MCYELRSEGSTVIDQRLASLSRGRIKSDYERNAGCLQRVEHSKRANSQPILVVGHARDVGVGACSEATSLNSRGSRRRQWTPFNRFEHHNRAESDMGLPRQSEHWTRNNRRPGKQTVVSDARLVGGHNGAMGPVALACPCSWSR